MPLPPYVARLRAHIGHDLLMLPSATGVVRDDAGRILLARRADNGRWTLPGGIVDPGEQPSDAALREIREETGVDAEIERLGGVALHPATYPNGDVCEYLNVWFRCRAIGGSARVNDDESTEVGWYAADSLPELDGWASLLLETTDDPDGPSWYSPPGLPHPALSLRDAL